MAVEIITKEDLNTFKIALLDDIRKLLQANGKLNQKQWLKSYEVRKLLGISPGTLQNLRINGTIPYTQIGGLMFYSYDDIVKTFEEKFKVEARKKVGLNLPHRTERFKSDSRMDQPHVYK